MAKNAKSLVKLTIAGSCMLSGVVFPPLLVGAGIPWGELLNALVGIASNNAASAIDALIEQQGSDRITLPNDHLTKTVGRAIAAVIALTAQQHPGKIGSYLEKIAAQAAQNWVNLSHQELTQQRHSPLQAGQVESFLTLEEKWHAQEGNLTVTDWEDIFRRLNMAACRGGGFPLPSEVYGQVAGLLNKYFPEALKAALQSDFATDGQAFAGVTLQLLTGIQAQLSQLQTSQTGIDSAEFTHTLQQFRQIERQLQGTVTEQQAFFQQLSLTINSGFAEVCQQLGAMETTITGLLRTVDENLACVREDVAVVREEMHYGFEQLRAQRGGRELSRQEYRIRQALLTQMRTEVHERLSQSLHYVIFGEQSPLTLGKEQQPHQVQRPWDVSVKLGERQSLKLSSNTSIQEIFQSETIGGRLLILGKPGSGKTTTLLELAQALVAQAEQDGEAPIPVILELSTWQKVTKRKQLPFSKPEEYDPSIQEWVLTQLQRRGVPPKVAEQWLQSKELVLLLDGLDELPSKRHAKCVQALNEFVASEFCPIYLVVCSRQEEYENFQETLYLNGAIVLNDLEIKQIKSYLARIQLENLWEHICANRTLLNLIQTPLFLIMFTKVNQENIIMSGTDLINHFVNEQLHRGNIKDGFSKRETYYLTWLAKQLSCSIENEFSIYSLRRGWLHNCKKEICLYDLIIRTFSILTTVSVLLAALWLSRFDSMMRGLFLAEVTQIGVSNGFSIWRNFWLLSGMVFSALLGEYLRHSVRKINFPSESISTNNDSRFSLNEFKNNLLNGLTIGLLTSCFGTGILFMFLFYTGLQNSSPSIVDPSQVGVADPESTMMINAFISSVVALFSSLAITFVPLSIALLALLQPLSPSMEYFLLRIILDTSGHIPRNYDSFFKRAEDLLLIQRVGKRYRFIHRLVQDHFANLEIQEP
jgi:DNA polymerase III delta prime subunit